MVVPGDVALAFRELIKKDTLTEEDKASARSMLDEHGSDLANYRYSHGIRPLWVCAQNPDQWRSELARELVEKHGAVVNFQCSNQFNLLNTLYHWRLQKEGAKELAQYFYNKVRR